MSSVSLYARRSLQLRAAEYYASIRKPKSEWKTIEDLTSQLVEFEHRVFAGDYAGAYTLVEQIDSGYLYLWGYYTSLITMRMRLWGELQDPLARAQNLDRLGLYHYYIGQISYAHEFFEASLAIAREIGNRRVEGICLEHIARTQLTQGQFEQANGFYEQALAIAREMGNRQHEGVCLGRLGITARRYGFVTQAIQLFGEALMIAQETADHAEEARHLGDLGSAYRDLGEFTKAIHFHQQAIALTREIGYRREEIIWLHSLGTDYEMLNRVDEAMAYYEEALGIAYDIGYRVGIGQQLVNLGRILLHQKKWGQAADYCREAIALDMSGVSPRGLLMLGITLLQFKPKDLTIAREAFANAVIGYQNQFRDEPESYSYFYPLATTLVGQAICDSYWADLSQRANLLAPALAEYRHALDITSAPGVVLDVLRDLELIRTAGVEGLELVFELLEGTLNG